MIALFPNADFRKSSETELKLMNEADVTHRQAHATGSCPDEFLDRIPRLAEGNTQAHDQPVFQIDPFGIAAEQFRIMQRRLRNLRPRGGSLLMTSPGAGDGKSMNAHNLAWALTESGESTLLLELDLRRPSQSRFLSRRPPYSVLDVLNGKKAALTAVRRIGELPLFYLGLDKPAPSQVGLLRSESLNELMHWAKQIFRWVVVDGPPVLAVSDVEEIVPKVDLVLMVVRERVTPRSMVSRAADHLGSRLNFVIYNSVFISEEYGYR